MYGLGLGPGFRAETLRFEIQNELESSVFWLRVDNHVVVLHYGL